MKILFLLMLSLSLYGELFKVVKVVDGDTINVVDSEDRIIKIRLAYIDTMESMRNNRAKKIARVCNLNIEEIVSIGKTSKKYLTEILTGRYININMYGLDNTKRRTVGEIFLINDPESVNIKMIKYGYGLPYYFYIKKMNEDLMYYEFLRVNSNSITIPLLTNDCVLDLLKK